MRASAAVILDFPNGETFALLLGGPVKARRPGESLQGLLTGVTEPQVFFVTSEPGTIREVAALDTAQTLIPVGFYSAPAQARELDDAGAWFLMDDTEELVRLLNQPRLPVSLSMVLIAYNEEGAIARAILDADRVGRLFLADYEIVAVDDGSSDRTRERILSLNDSMVRLVTHERNQGMGAALRDGFLAASKDFIAPLPADRQVRAQSLLTLLREASETVSVVSTYRGVPSGWKRAVLSVVFRLILRVFGGLDVNFAGSYVFHRKWLPAVDPATIPLRSYLFSFEVLRRLRRAGAALYHVRIRPFPRETGASTEIRLSRMAYVLRELVSARWGRRG